MFQFEIVQNWVKKRGFIQHFLMCTDTKQVITNGILSLITVILKWSEKCVAHSEWEWVKSNGKSIEREAGFSSFTFTLTVPILPFWCWRPRSPWSSGFQVSAYIRASEKRGRPPTELLQREKIHFSFLLFGHLPWENIELHNICIAPYLKSLILTPN